MPCFLSTSCQIHTSGVAYSVTPPVRFHFTWVRFESNLYNDIKKDLVFQDNDYLFNGLFRITSTKIQSFALLTLWEGSLGNWWIPSQRPSNTENVSLSRCNHEHCCFSITKVKDQLQMKCLLYVFRKYKYSLCNLLHYWWLSSAV